MMRRPLSHQHDFAASASGSPKSCRHHHLPVLSTSAGVRLNQQQHQQHHHQQHRRFYYFPLRSFCVVSALVLVSIHLYLLQSLLVLLGPSTTTTSSTSTSLLQPSVTQQQQQVQVQAKVAPLEPPELVSIDFAKVDSNADAVVLNNNNNISEEEEKDEIEAIQQRRHLHHDLITPLTPLPRKSLPPPLIYPVDYERYTIRINSWKREEQLKLAIEHFSTCGKGDGESSVALIQVVWCTAQGPPPQWLLELEQQHTSKTSSSSSSAKNATTSGVTVVVEQHEINSLNERFRILPQSTTTATTTAAILSIDDDVLRPCVALDAAFVKWTRNPYRMVGFDARTIIVEQEDKQQLVSSSSNKQLHNSKHYKYGYLSSTKKANEYALTLSRFAFVHAHYLNTYLTDMPQSMRDFVDQHFNCEDIALSLWVSYQTNNLPPLLADYWAMKTQLKLYSKDAISSTNQHKEKRDECVQMFASLLDMDVSRLLAPFVHHDSKKNGVSWFDCGADEEKKEAAAGVGADADAGVGDFNKLLPLRLQRVQELVWHWKTKKSHKTMSADLNAAVREMAFPAFERGYLKDTAPWKKKFGSSRTSSGGKR